jgi:hypothetical protein
MVSAALTEAQRIGTGDAVYGLALRYRRAYLPFTIHLKDFRHDTFTGTSIARNFSSDIRIVDPEHATDRETRIWMNNPLRYRGLTFYQASYKPDGSGTVLQVVRNPGWLMPYIACALVAGGMIVHFAMSLIAFLRRRSKSVGGEGRVGTGATRRFWPWFVGLAGVCIACTPLLRPAPASALDTRAFAELPVSAGGRIKPMDTAARSMLMVAGGRQTAEAEDGPVPARRFLLDLIANPDRVAGLPVIRVDHPDLLAMLGLTPEDGGRLALAQIEPQWERGRGAGAAGCGCRAARPRWLPAGGAAAPPAGEHAARARPDARAVRDPAPVARRGVAAPSTPRFLTTTRATTRTRVLRISWR